MVMVGLGEPSDLQYLEELGNAIKTTSRCGLGQMSPNPVLTTLANFRHMYEAMVEQPTEGKTGSFDIHEALAEAQGLTGRRSVHFTK